MTVFWWLIVGHFLCDFALQSDSMARGKNHTRVPENIPPGATPQTVWPYWLTSHAAIHGGMVALVTGSILLGTAEFALHWLIDWGKCSNAYGVHMDQGFHVVSKVLWALS